MDDNIHGFFLAIDYNHSGELYVIMKSCAYSLLYILVFISYKIMTFIQQLLLFVISCSCIPGLCNELWWKELLQRNDELGCCFLYS